MMTLIRLVFLTFALAGAVYLAALNADLQLADVAMLGALGPFPGGWLVGLLFGAWSLALGALAAWWQLIVWVAAAALAWAATERGIREAGDRLRAVCVCRG